MKQDEIMEMARQAGLIVNSPYLMPHDHVMRGIEAFAKLVADAATAKEREACAKVCEELKFSKAGPSHDALRQRLLCAEAIRARGETTLRGESWE